jgi:hypothetical protein
MLLVVLATTHLEDLDLVVTAVGNHGCRDGAGHHGVPILTDSPSPTAKTWSMVICEPTSAGICSTLSFSPATTRYCLPPVFMTAYMDVLD